MPKEEPQASLAELIKRHLRPLPRYTSYPTAADFEPEMSSEEACRLLRLVGGDEARGPLGVYVHLPFCLNICTFCGCSSISTPRKDAVTNYLDHLHREIELVRDVLGEGRALGHVHWGGGTPNTLTDEQMVRLHTSISGAFSLLEGAEISMELDPRTATTDQLDLLSSLGFTRVSFGVQDFDPRVQEAVKRVQPFDMVARLHHHARARGFRSVNFDLIYGLPYQTMQTWDETLARVLDLRPDRLAVYAFAFVPWMKRHQKKLDQEALPGAAERLAMFLKIRDCLLEDGYEQIGMDHFVLPDDELAAASREKRLHRDFQGYTTRRTKDLLSFGITAISEVGGTFLQNEKKLGPYYRTVDSGRLPVTRGVARTKDDEIRSEAIEALMCNFELDLDAFCETWSLDPVNDFAIELEELGKLEEDGLCELQGHHVTVTATGRLFVRNVASVFDSRSRERLARAALTETPRRHAQSV
jgi:oxygen-independent coproporphyrinogen III oxidase